jgi:hypothetical protein
VQELEAAQEYDFIVYNDDQDDAIAAVSGILDAESVRGDVEGAKRLQQELRLLAKQM